MSKNYLDNFGQVVSTFFGQYFALSFPHGKDLANMLRSKTSLFYTEIRHRVRVNEGSVSGF